MVTERVPTTIWYRSSDTVTAFSDGAGAKTAAANMNAQYMSAILSPLSMREDGQDIYGNIKVPVLEKLNQSMVDDDGWIAVGGGPVEYAGLLGVPTAGLTDSGIMNYMIETSYFVLECDKPMTITMDEAKEEKYGRVGNQLTQLRPFTMSLNLTAEDRARAGSNTIRKEESPSAGNLVFASIGAQIYTSGGIPPIIWIGCKLRMAHVESIVHCEGKVCGVISMRKSLLVQAPANLTPFDGMGLQVPVLFLSNFIAASGELHQSDSSTATEQFLFDPNAVFNDTANSRVDLEAVSLEDFTTRLSLLFNTYWSASLAPYSFQSVSGNLSALDPLPDVPFLFGRIGDPAIPQNRDAPFLARKSNTILSLYGERYICNWRWLLLYMFSSCVLLGVALLGVVVQRLTIAPDIFGYASSFTRDNPYTDLPPEADICTLDGVQRARILRDLSVRLADVKPGEKVGHVAFVTSGVKESGELSPGAARVRTGRSYY